MDGVPLGWTTAIEFPKPQPKDQTVGKPNRNGRIHQFPPVGDVPIEQSINEQDDRKDVEKVDHRDRPNREPSDKSRFSWMAIRVPEREEDNRDGFKHHHQPLWAKHNLIG